MERVLYNILVMEHVTGSTILWLTFGLIVNAILRLKTLRQKKQEFSLGYWLKDNWMVIIVSIIGGIASVRFSDIILNFMNLQVVGDSQTFYDFHALISGLICHNFFSHLEGWVNIKIHE